MQLTPFWTDHYPRPMDLPVAPFPQQADVAIIGGGYTGLHAARTLARAGADVVVLEQQTVGWGASSRNGGMLNPGLKEAAPVLFQRYGAERGRALWQWSLDAIDFVERVVGEEGISCDFQRYGQVVLAYKPAHFAALRHEVTWHRDQLCDTVPEIVAPQELASEIGSISYYGGVRDTRAAGLNPAKYVYGLARAAVTAGAKLVEGAGVQAVHKLDKGYQLQTVQGNMTAREVLLATNGYTNNLLPQARRGIFTGGSYIITTAPLVPALQQTISPRARMFYDSKHFLNYFRLTAEGRMLLGGRHNLSADLDLERSAQALRRRMVAIFPQLADVPLSHSWTGRLGLTFDLMPHAGRLQGGTAPGVFYAYGYCGHGVAIASYLGHAMGQLLAGQPSDNPILALSHPRYFFAPYERFYLPLVSAWFRFLDRVR